MPSSTLAASATALSTEENPTEVLAELSTAPGTHTFKVNNYHAKLM